MARFNIDYLKKREAKFKERLKERNWFTYIKGYAGYKYPVIVKHNACGNEFMAVAETLLAHNKIDTCMYCSDSSRYKDKEDIQELLDNMKANLIYKGTEIVKERKLFVVECKDCKHIYKITYNQLKNNTFKCCHNGISIYKKHMERTAKNIIKEIKPSYLEGKELFNYIAEQVDNISYIKSKSVDKDKFIIDILEFITEYYHDKKIGKCLICGEYKKGTQWGAYGAHFEEKLCISCLDVKQKCNCCLIEQPRKNFDFDKKTNKFKKKCQRCSYFY